MRKKKLFDDDSEEEQVSFKTQNEYAKKYDKWREKEELHKLEQKYGSKGASSDASGSSDSEDESDEPPEVSEEMETQFLKTLAFLKTKDPRIYSPTFKCFDDKKEKNEEEKSAKVPKVTFEDSDEDDSDDGNIFKIEKKADIDTDTTVVKKGNKIGKDGKIKDFLTGKVEHIDEDVEQDLAPLKALWSDPKLNEGEAFLRDYILNKRYLEEGDVGEAEDKIRDDEDLEEDEKRVEEQGQFERAYNFRFEEPDQEFLKRYPRTMNYTRPKDTRRAEKRVEVKTRKEEEKKRKMEEIARMKALKLKEIQEKIERIKEVTGNQELAFREEDIEGDFDPLEHDRRMQALFDEEFYGGADHHKPVFPDLDDELEIENWDKFDPDSERSEREGQKQGEDGLHCEDDDFNMDADYDPKQAKANLIEEIQSTLVKKRRNRKKKSKLAQLLASEKPKFVPTVADRTYDQYMEEYYKMDCEDVIGGDLPTRFKYREVVPNDFGLTIEEILLADDKELTQWVPLKKIVKHRSKDVEKSEVNTYRQKAADVTLKKKILPSLFKDLPKEPEIVAPLEEATKKKKKKKKNKDKDTEVADDDIINASQDERNETNSLSNNKQSDETTTKTITPTSSKSEGKIKKKKHKKDSNSNGKVTEAMGVSNEKKQRKDSATELNEIENVEFIDKDKEGTKEKKKRRKESESKPEHYEELSPQKKKRHKDSLEVVASNIINTELELNKTDQLKNQGELNGKLGNNKKKKKKHKSDRFIVENVQNPEPSQTGHKGMQNEKGKSNLKRKLDQQGQVSNKKQKLGNNKQNNKNKFKQNKLQNKQGEHKTPMNPLTNLSDERLKAYGLNPKKYRSFLKYKKF